MRDNVKRGATWLDEHHPGWADKIEIDELDMGVCRQCIAGQLYGRFKNLPVPPDVGLYCSLEYNRWVINHGFDFLGNTENLYQRYEELRDLWVEEVLARRNTTPLETPQGDTP